MLSKLQNAQYKRSEYTQKLKYTETHEETQQQQRKQPNNKT